MVVARLPSPRWRQSGTTAIEILVTLVIVAFGMLGIAGLQMRLQVSEVEAYQRSQALLLVNDMANRIASNRGNAASYVTGVANPLGEGATCTTTTTTTKDRDLGDWCNALKGAAELSGTTKVGSLIGGRGCVELTDGDYVVTVAWQGVTPLAPPAGSTCGATLYNGASGTPCVNDLCRRTVSTIVRIATLS